MRAVLACAAKVVGPAGARNLQAPWRQAGSEGDIPLPHFPSKPRGFEGIKYNTCSAEGLKGLVNAGDHFVRKNRNITVIGA